MTSVLNSSSQATHSVKRPDKSTPSGKHPGAAGDPSGEFGALFGTLMEVAPGQDVAAPAEADGKTSPKMSGLAAEILGPAVHIITTTEPATSDESLMAFARSQGMDEEALAMIFGRRAAEAVDAKATAADVLAAAQLRSQASLTRPRDLRQQPAMPALPVDSWNWVRTPASAGPWAMPARARKRASHCNRPCSG